MGRAPCLLLALLLAACGPQLVSREPLFAAGPEQLKPGLWALLTERACATPTDGDIFAWPECAVPLLVEPGRLSLLTPNPLHADLLLADGDPRIVQLGATEARLTRQDEEQGSIAYYAFKPESPPPFTAGLVHDLRCPAAGAGIAGIAIESDEEQEGCRAETGDAVRAVAARLDPNDGWNRAAWIADWPG